MTAGAGQKVRIDSKTADVLLPSISHPTLPSRVVDIRTTG